MRVLYGIVFLTYFTLQIKKKKKCRTGGEPGTCIHTPKLYCRLPTRLPPILASGDHGPTASLTWRARTGWSAFFKPSPYIPWAHNTSHMPPIEPESPSETFLSVIRLGKQWGRKGERKGWRGKKSTACRSGEPGRHSW